MTANLAGYSQATRPSCRLLGMKTSSARLRSRGGWSSTVICSRPSPTQRTSFAISRTAAAQPRWLSTVVRLTMSASYLRFRRGQSARTAWSHVHCSRSAKEPAGSLTSSASGSRPPADWDRSNLATLGGTLRTAASSCSNVTSPGRGGTLRSTGSHRPDCMPRARAVLNGSVLIRSRNAWPCRASQSRSHGWGLRAASTPSALTVSASGEVTNRLAASTSAVTSHTPMFRLPSKL
jgi:hypothetical protein